MYQGSLIRGMESDLGCIQMPFLEHQVIFPNILGVCHQSFKTKNQDTKSVKNGLAFVSSNRCFSALGMSPGFNGDETKVQESLFISSNYAKTVWTVRGTLLRIYQWLMISQTPGRLSVSRQVATIISQLWIHGLIGCSIRQSVYPSVDQFISFTFAWSCFGLGRRAYAF